MKTYLKVKIMSLAAEAKIIRQEEAIAKMKRGGLDPLFRGLREHRINDVRKEARSAGLAYGFLRGRLYRRIEQKTHRDPDWKRVEALALKYGAESEIDRLNLKQRFAEWKDAA